MPIKPENKKRYPANWKQIRESILERAHNRCEFCGKQNHTYFWNEKTGKMVKVVLTIAHLDHTPENCDPENLRALCQACHNRYDAKHRAETRSMAFHRIFVERMAKIDSRPKNVNYQIVENNEE
jgi:5-methylcytosine-specific restriction endonuclease McrA